MTWLLIWEFFRRLFIDVNSSYTGKCHISRNYTQLTDLFLKETTPRGEDHKDAHGAHDLSFRPCRKIIGRRPIWRLTGNALGFWRRRVVYSTTARYLWGKTQIVLTGNVATSRQPSSLSASVVSMCDIGAATYMIQSVLYIFTTQVLAVYAAVCACTFLKRYFML